MTHDFGRGLRRLAAATAFGAATMFAAGASAVTLTSLKDQGLEAAYGEYAPGGNCAREPRITVAESGFSYRAGGRTAQPRSFELALSFFGPDYDGVSAAVFPFPVTDSDYGPLIMIVNDEEKVGVIRLEANVAPGQRLDPFHAALAKAGPYLRCGGAAAAAPPRTAPKAAAAPAPGVPADWANLPSLVGRYDVDLFGAGPVAASIRTLLGDRTAALRRNLQAVSPLKRQGGIYYLSGNMARQGGMEQAYVLIDAARRSVQVGLWERGKLTVYAPPGRRMAPPPEIRQLLDRSPPEDAVAAPGTPWEVVPVQGGPTLAFVNAAASPNIKSLSLFCQNGRTLMAVLLNRPPRSPSLVVTWNFAGGLVNVPVARGNREGTFWQADVTGTRLTPMLLGQSGSAYLRLNSQLEGEASLAGAPAALRTALRGCQRN